MAYRSIAPNCTELSVSCCLKELFLPNQTIKSSQGGQRESICSCASEIILSNNSESSPISNCQWNFLRCSSANSALTSVVQDWLRAFQEGNEVDVINYTLLRLLHIYKVSIGSIFDFNAILCNIYTL